MSRFVLRFWWLLFHGKVRLCRRCSEGGSSSKETIRNARIQPPQATVRIATPESPDRLCGDHRGVENVKGGKRFGLWRRPVVVSASEGVLVLARVRPKRSAEAYRKATGTAQRQISVCRARRPPLHTTWRSPRAGKVVMGPPRKVRKHRRWSMRAGVRDAGLKTLFQVAGRRPLSNDPGHYRRLKKNQSPFGLHSVVPKSWRISAKRRRT